MYLGKHDLQKRYCPLLCPDIFLNCRLNLLQWVLPLIVCSCLGRHQLRLRFFDLYIDNSNLCIKESRRLLFRILGSCFAVLPYLFSPVKDTSIVTKKRSEINIQPRKDVKGRKSPTEVGLFCYAALRSFFFIHCSQSEIAWTRNGSSL